MKGRIGMKQNKTFIVITGQIASGKTALSQLIAKNYPEFLILDADNQVNDLYRRGAELYNILVKEFGEVILNDKGNISKSRLREIVFFNEKNRKKLNALTHGIILERMINMANFSGKDIVFLQIPLLNESIGKLKKLINISEVWNVTADREVRFERLMTRKGMTPEIANRIMEIQSEFDSDDYDIINIQNNGTIEELENSLPIIIENSCISDFVVNLDDEELKEENSSTEEILDDEVEEMQEEAEVSNINPEETGKYEDLSKDVATAEKTENEPQDIGYMNLGDTTTINIDGENSENFDEYMKEIEYISFLNRESNLGEDKKIEIEIEDEEQDLPKKSKKKKKRGIGRKILAGVIFIVLILNTILFGAIAYGGKNYPLEYIEEINKYSAEYGVDPKIVLAIMRVESNFDPNAHSKANAKGLMQILPETSKHISKLLKIDENSVDLNDPETNIKYGTYYIKYLMQNFKDLNTVYAAYNGGIGNVNTWLKDEKYSNDGVTLYNIPVEETKHYVYKVNKALDAYEILYGKEFPTKKEKGFKKFIKNVKNVFKHIFSSF